MAKFDFGARQGLLEVDVDTSLDIWAALRRWRLLRSRLLAALLLELRFAATLSTHEWVEKLTTNGVPTGPIWSVPEALAHPQLADRGLLQTHRVGSEDLQLVGIGAKLDGVAPGVDSPPPTLGEHTNDILSELGYDKAQISGLKEEGAI